MAKAELTQEDVFNNDVDPLDGIRALRKDQGVPDEELIPAPDSDTVPVSAAEEPEDTSLDEFEAANTGKNTGEEEEGDGEVEDAAGSDVSGTDVSDADPDDDGSDEEPVSKSKRIYKANGQEFEFTEDEILDQFETVFGKAMDYTQKMQKIAPYRKMISALEKEGLSETQLNLAIDALKGDKGALTKMLAMNDVDPFDLGDEEEANYTPREYGDSPDVEELREVVSGISKDVEYKITVDVVDNQWDSSSRDVLRKNPGMISGLHNDIKNGIYDKVAPVAMKMKVLDGNTKSDIEYYMLAGQQLQIGNQAKNEVDNLNGKTQAAVGNAAKASSEANRKRSASSTGSRADRKGVVDYLDDDDDSFDEWYKKTMSNL